MWMNTYLQDALVRERMVEVEQIATTARWLRAAPRRRSHWHRLAARVARLITALTHPRALPGSAHRSRANEA